MSRQPKPSALSAAQQAELVRAKRAARWVGLIFPLALLTAALVLVLVWIPRMPNPAATHWSGSGAPDGFGSPWSYVWILLFMGHGFVLMLWAFVVFGSRMPAPSPKRQTPIWSANQRFLAAFAAGFAVLMTITMLASVVSQLDIADAADARGIGAPLAIGLGAWIAVAVLGWFVQPKVEITRAEGRPSEPLPLAASERAVWFGEVRPSKTFLWVTGLAILAVAASVVFMFAVPTDAVARGISIGALLLIVGLSLTSTLFRVRIDAAGLVARSFIGWPVFRLPADDVQSVEAGQINPLAEFSGWGMRWSVGRFGIVMRTGEGIIATRKDGRIFAITVDDAETAAAALAASASAATTKAASRGERA